ncbi:MAG: hypothetical protein H0T79_20680 [Deltaproteobacteria bacterium]|nr:hypothetical protein [Deltaproteobacteria bacterium]
MKSACRIGVALALGLAPGAAVAEHVHHGGHHPGGPFSTAVSLVAARFETPSYGGDYQGVSPAIAWARDRLGVAVAVTLYRLQENGRTLYGLGDTMLGGHALITSSAHASAGVSLMMMLPTGATRQGFGMGHVMAMPEVFGSYHTHPMTVAGSIGFARAVTTERAHQHGSWPLVDPMNMSELTWSASSELHVLHTAARAITAGARVSGGIPVGQPGTTRVVGGVRVAWVAGNLTSAVEVQTGLLGDPFTVRGVLQTSVSF